MHFLLALLDNVTFFIFDNMTCDGVTIDHVMDMN